MLITLLSYSGMFLVSIVSSYFSLPMVLTSISAGFGTQEQYSPILIGLIISIGAGIGSTVAQKTGQLIFQEKEGEKCSKLKSFTIRMIEKYKKHSIFLIIVCSLTFLPESWIFFTIAKDYSKVKMFFILLWIRWINFSLVAFLGENFLQKIMQAIIN